MTMMDFITATRPQKRKTYGKKPASGNNAFSQFAESPQKPKAPRSTWSPEPSPPPAAVVSPASKPGTRKLKRPSPKHAHDPDLFDFPPSDSERANHSRPQKRLKSPPTRVAPHRRLIPIVERNTASQHSDHSSGDNMARKRKPESDPAETQLLQENARYLEEIQSVPVNGHDSSTRAPIHMKSPGVQEVATRAPKKRITPTVKQSVPVNKPRQKQLPKSLGASANLARKYVSSPARLEEMVCESSNSVALHDEEQAFAAPTGNGHESSPRTPPRASASPGSVGSPMRSGTATPKQRALWSKLLGDTGETASPSGLAVDKLRITSTVKKPTTTNLLRAASDIGPPAPRRPGRLIDTLSREMRQTMPQEDADEDDSMADDSSMFESSLEDAAAAQQAEAEVTTASQGQAASKVTYGQVRSYMEDSSLGTDLLMESPIVPLRKATSAMYGNQSHGSQALPIHPRHDDEDFESSQGQMKGIHELRAAGESERFSDDFHNLLEDVQYRAGSSWSRQRSGLMEMCERLMDRKYVGRMVDAGLDQRFLTACSGASDPIYNFSVATAIALIADAEVPLSVLRYIRQPECFDMLFQLLELETDVLVLAKERKSNMSRVAQSSLADLCDKMKGSTLWEGMKPSKLSPHVIALRAIELVVRRMRSLRHMDDLLDEQKTSQLLQVLERRIGERDRAAVFDALSLELALSTLEAGSVVPGRIQTAWTPKRMKRLADVFPDILKLEVSNAALLTPLALRLLLNLTNGKETASTAFANARVVQTLVASISRYFLQLSTQMTAGSDEEVAIDDRLILSLGAMINLAEFSDTARTTITGEHQYLLDDLVSIFLQNRGKAAEADNLALTASNVAYGYLTVLLGNLCENEQVRRAVAAQLPGGNLLALIEAIEEFVAYNKVADRSGFEGEEGGTVWRVFTERLANVAERLREAEFGF